jgi:DNA-binding transcriptional MerR regulator/AcrR family transcriptional regulator
MGGVIAYLHIGDFSRATHLTVKTLRHYHQLGLLEPADVDPHSGYRRYTTDQLPTAQVIRRFRDLGMPLEEIQQVLAAPDLTTRNQRITAHLNRLENELRETRNAVASLRDLLAPAADVPARIELRDVKATPAAAISEVIDAGDSVTWFQGALGELHATLAAQHAPAGGPPGGIFADEVFTHHRGRATIFVPCAGPIRPTGRVAALIVPAVELAVIEHAGSPAEVDRAYGTLAAWVARHALAVDGPIREYYLVGQRDTADVSRWRTEIGWPVFRTGSGPAGAALARAGDLGVARWSGRCSARPAGRRFSRNTSATAIKYDAVMARWEPNARDRLVGAALDLYGERGFEKTTAAEIAKRAGLTERTFFRYFRDKPEVLFWGASMLQERIVALVAEAPASAAPIDAVASALEATADIFGQIREHSVKRQAVIEANAELRERELIKMATLAAAIAETLRRRGVGEPAATLTAEVGIAAFKTAFQRWINEPAQQDFAKLIRETIDQLRAVTAGDRH